METDAIGDEHSDLKGSETGKPNFKEFTDIEEKESEKHIDLKCSGDAMDIVEASSTGQTQKTNNVKSDKGNMELGRQDSSGIDIAKLGFVEVSTSDLKESDTSSSIVEVDKVHNIKFAVEIDEDDCEAFSEFVDRVSVISQTKDDETGTLETEVSEEALIQYMKRHQTKHLKVSLRTGLWDVRHKIRRALWFNLCHHLHKADESDIFSEFAEDLFGPGKEEKKMFITLHLDYLCIK